MTLADLITPEELRAALKDNKNGPLCWLEEETEKNTDFVNTYIEALDGIVPDQHLTPAVGMLLIVEMILRKKQVH